MAYFARCYSAHVADFYDSIALRLMNGPAPFEQSVFRDYDEAWERAWYWHNRSKQGARI